MKDGKRPHLEIWILAGLVLIGIAAAFIISHDKMYRKIQVYQMDGKGEVAREGRKIEPYANMMLQNGDHLRTLEDSWLYMKMDDDKYVLAEPLTSFGLVASGTRKDSKTKLHLETGALVNHIMNPLSEKSSYEVTTPNSVMAVRGTSFRVYVWYDENGVSHTILQVFEGVVEVHLRYPNGSLSKEGRTFGKGTTVSIWGDSSTSDYDFVEDTIDYVELEIKTLEFLKIAIRDSETGAYSITIPDVDEIIRLKQTYFDVIFMADEQKVFGKQSILFNHYASEPKLKPTMNGHWDFDFEEKILGETKVYWVEE